MNILLVASAWTKQEGFLAACNAFERMGHYTDYLPVNMRAIELGRPIISATDDKRDNEAKVAGLKALQYDIVNRANRADLVIFWKGDLVSLSTLDHLNKYKKTLYYCFDDPYEVEVSPRSFEFGSRCKVATTCCQATADKYAKAGVKSTLWVPPGADPSVHYASQEPEVDVCFIGTNTYCKELYGNKCFDRRDLVKAALEITDKIELWGSGDNVLGWTHETHGDPSFKPYYKGFIPFVDAKKAFSRAKVVINSHVRRNGYKYFNERTFQIMSTNRAQLIDDNPGTKEVLGDTVETYNTIDELKEKLKYILNDQKHRLQLASSSHALLLKEFTWDHFAQRILKAAEAV